MRWAHDAAQTSEEALHVRDGGRRVVRHIGGKRDIDRRRAGWTQIDERGANVLVEQKEDLAERVEEADEHGNGEVHLSASLAKRPVEPRLELEMVVMSTEVATRVAVAARSVGVGTRIRLRRPVHIQ